MWSPVEKCWVPNCLNSSERGYAKNFFPLPTSARYKEIWLSLAGKKFSGLEDLIYFCQDHFDPNVVETYMDKFVCLNATATPYFNMPERICRTCMSIIMDGDRFSVLSAKVPCTIPADIKSELLTCRPEALLQVLNFCIPDLNLSHDPLPLSCYKCYHNIWLFYIFKLTCNAVEKSVLGTMTPADYGKLVVCRSCPTTSGNSVFMLKEESPIGKLLKKMFLTNHAVEIVPLKVCLKCWNILYKLEKFYQQCLTVEQKMQRHLALNQFSESHISTPSTSLALPQCKTQLSHLRDFRKFSNPYLSATQSSSQAYPRPETDSVASTSVIKFSGKCEAGYVEKPVEDVPNGDLVFRMRNNVLEKIHKDGMSAGISQGTNFAQNPNPAPNSTDTLKADISDDEVDSENKDKDPTTKQRLTPTEKIALAQLMLKHGAPLKANVSPMIHFEAWVNIVREFHQQGYERPLEIIQKSWKSMKKKAEMACETIGPATEVNRIIMDYLKDYSSPPGDSQQGDCEVICIDDETCNKKKVAVALTDAEQVITPPKGSGRGRKPGPLHKRTIEDSPKPSRKKKVKKEKKEETKYQTRDHWDQERKLELVRNMRKQYEICLRDAELSSGKSPWKMIIERLVETNYPDYPFEKLYSTWSRIKTSATIHEKNGFDLVDEEVWDMLQLQNAVQKSVVAKTQKAEKEDEASSGTSRDVDMGDDKSTIKDATPRTAETSKTSPGTNRDVDLSDDSNLPPLVKEMVEKKVTRRKKRDSGGSDSGEKPAAPALPSKKPAEAASDSDGGRASTPKSKRYCQWSEADKMRLVKLIKAEFTDMLKHNEAMGTGPWRRCIDRIIDKGYNDKPIYSVYSTWTQIRRTAAWHENGGQMSMLDQKVLRLMKLLRKTRSTQKIAKGSVTESDAVEEDAEVKETQVKVDENQVKVDEVNVKPDKTQTKTEEKQSESDKEITHRINLQQKMEVISIVTSYGGEVFKLKKDRSGKFWPKVLERFNAGGHKWDKYKIRNCWNYLFTSAKHAWADQKTPNELDKAIIEFMTEVIREKNREAEGATKGEEEDDSFDEISGKMTNGDDNGAPEMNYDYVSLEDIQKNYGVDDGEQKREDVVVKNEPPEEALPFKIESYQSEHVIEISDED